MSEKSPKMSGLMPGPAPDAPGHARVTEPVVARALLRVAEHGVRLGGRLEALFGRRVAVIAVWMVLQRQLPIGALDVCFGRVPGDSQDLVVILTTHAFATFTSAGRMSREPIR